MVLVNVYFRMRKSYSAKPSAHGVGQAHRPIGYDLPME